MDTEKLRSWQSWIRTELESSVNFWLKNGMDPEHGGIYTCLTREGKVFSTDKSVWMQGRCGWIFAHMCRLYGTRPEWLEASGPVWILWKTTASTAVPETGCTSP